MNISSGEGGSADDRPDLLSPFEVEAYSTALEKSKVYELGSLGWLEKHERVKQLAVQSIIQALSSREETVKESLITHEKLPILVYELILIELWRERVFLELLKHPIQGGFTIYPILYHESACINLLETVLYHADAAETLGDACLDITDYCLRTLNYFISTTDFEEDGDDPDEGIVNENTDLRKQSESLLLGISMKCLSTLRYIIENIETLGSGLVSRLVISSDAPTLLVEVIIRKPWRKEFWKDNKVMDFDPTENRWKEIDPSNRILIGNIEAQAWLGIYMLLKNNQILSSYELYDSRKNQLLKLRPYLNDVTVDQIPILGEFQLFLNQLAVTSGSFGPERSPLLLELVPPIRDALEEKFDKNRVKILESYKKEFLSGSRELMFEKAQKLASAYNFESFQSALPIVKQCAFCGKDAVKKCSKCLEAWYCGRECQVSHWGDHRKVCAS